MMLTTDQKADILDRILDLLQDEMNLEQVCYCKECHFWGTVGERIGSSPIYNDLFRYCRKYSQDKLWNDYCSDGVKHLIKVNGDEE